MRTTQIYAKIVDENKRKAVNLVPSVIIKTNSFWLLRIYLFVCIFVGIFAIQNENNGRQ